MREGLNEALLNANAESASHAMLLSPLSAHEDEAEDNKLASKVLTGGLSLRSSKRYIIYQLGCVLNCLIIGQADKCLKSLTSLQYGSI